MFPIISRIEDVRSVIAEMPEFGVMEKDDFDVIAYHYVTADSFHDPIARECRGLVFNKQGDLISRPFHKFFNIGEKAFTQLTELPRTGFVMDKLDGSMVRPVRLHGHTRWLTKRGISEVAMDAEVFVAKHSQFSTFANRMLDMGLTPIFEFCAPQHRIVVDHGTSMTLLAIRTNVSGGYIPRESLEWLARHHNIPLVRGETTVDIPGLVARVKGMENIEGYVIQFSTGDMVKIKTDWYVTRHKGKDLMQFEHEIIKLSLDGAIDDIYPDLDPDTQRHVDAVIDTFWHKHHSVCNIISSKMYGYKAVDRKTFATTIAPDLHPYTKAICFSAWTGEVDVFESANRILAKHLNGAKDFEEYKTWMETMLSDPGV